MRSIFIFIFIFGFLNVFSQEKNSRTRNFPRRTVYPVATPSSSNVWVFMMAGQSNMAGRGFVEPQDTLPHQRILSINAGGELIVAKEPLHFYEPSMAGLDCGVSFAQSLLKFIPDSVSILLVPTAVGGSSVGQWLGDSLHRNVKLLSNFREKMTVARKYGQLKGILWHQGESDAKPHLTEVYEEKLRDLFKLFREYAGSPLPVIMGETGVFNDDTPDKIKINQVIRRFAQTNHGVACVSANDLTHNGDKLHFDSKSQRLMGQRMALAWLNNHGQEYLLNLPLAGMVKSRPATEIESPNWMIGCETLDRDLADYDQYKEYLVPLGIKLLRMQAGWNKTEKIKGEYSWAWLDVIVDDATSRGLKPWLQTSYGNVLYKDGGGANLGAGMPLSKQAREAYYRWVEALVTRYKDKVNDWEVWNEPNFGDNTINTPELTAELNIRTAEIIKKIQPGARISGLALGHYNEDFVNRFFKYVGDRKKMALFDNITYHDYVYNPDANNHEVYLIRKELDKYAPFVKLRQGENGAPSAGGFGRGALGDYNWTELSQAKWNARRMLGNLGHDIECSIFTIVDIAYNTGPITRLNVKGIIRSDSSKMVLGPKLAYYSIQHIASVFDNSLERIKNLKHTYNIDNAMPGEHKYRINTDRSIAVFGYSHKTSKKQLYTIWNQECIPSGRNIIQFREITVTGGNFDLPVIVDIVTGAVYDIPATEWTRSGDTYTFRKVPVYDSPVVIADKSLIPVSELKVLNTR